jgi:tRNA modification GTPase
MNIFALSTGRGPAGIAIIRLSGQDTFEICKLIIKEKNFNLNSINLRKFYDPKQNSLIDEGILLMFKAPNSFTGDATLLLFIFWKFSLHKKIVD